MVRRPQASSPISSLLSSLSPRIEERGRLLLPLAAQVWPAAMAGRPVAGLPPAVAELLCPTKVKRGGARAAAELDRRLPGWVETAAEVIAHASQFPPELPRLCVLVGHRPVQDPQLLLRRLESLPDDPESRFWLLVALVGTDTAAVRRAWSLALTRSCNVPSLVGGRLTWFLLLRGLLGAWLTWPEFRDALTAGHALVAVTPDSSYRRPLERLGVWAHPTFAKWYRQVVYEVAGQPDAALSSSLGGWIRDFPGPDYLFDALSRLQENPSSWWPLLAARWSTELPTEDASFVEELRGFSPTALCLLSLVRPDLADHVESALSCPNHAEVIRWLLWSDPASLASEDWCQQVLAPWVDEYYEVITVATGALCSLTPPPDLAPDSAAGPAHRAFCLTHFGLDLEALMDNYLCVLALREDHFGLVEKEARRGRPGALRALALRPELAERTAPLLLASRRRGSRATRLLAETVLGRLAERAGLPDLPTLERRLDLAAAWADGGEAPAGLQWSVGGYQVRLAVTPGGVQQLVYAGDKLLRSVPQEVRRHPSFVEVRRARADQSRRYRYLRGRLERAMEEATAYPGPDFSVLLSSSLARTLVAGLVLLVEGREFLRAPLDPAAETAAPPVLADARDVTIAHPVLLHYAGTLEAWQERMVSTGLAQPFKQLFREIYLIGEEERETTACGRFAGRPVNARQAFALLRGRGYAPHSGQATKAHAHHRIRAHIAWAAENEPVGKLLGQAEPESPVTFGAVWFTRDDGEVMSLSAVPPVLFSETLRDADLTVSRAAFGEGGFSSEETRRLRALLIRHLARALGLTTIYVSEDHTHALIDGARALYRVHLGSGSVLLEPSRRHLDVGSLANEATYHALLEGLDSFTTHVVRTVLVLSRDHEITEAGFLNQL